MGKPRNIFRTLAPHLVALALFIAVPFAYFSPLLEGKLVAQHDREQWLGTARELIDHREAHNGQQSLWTNTLFGGMPSVLVSLSYPLNLIAMLDDALTAMPRPASYIMLTMLGFYILLLVMGVNPWVATAGAMAYGLSTYFFIIVGAGHNAKSHALCYMAPIVAGAIALYQKKYLGGALLFAIALALSLVAGHLQITYYTFFIVGAVMLHALYEAIKQKQLLNFAKTTSILILATILAIGANFNRLYNTWDYGRESIRGKSDLTLNNSAQDGGLDRDYATSWSYGLNESFNLIIPQFNGGASTVHLDAKSETAKYLRQLPIDPSQQQQLLRGLPVYWGPQPMTSGPVYIGASVFLLFLVALFLIRNPLKGWLAGIGLLALMLAWGKHFPWLTNLFFDLLPGYNKFRTVSMILVVCELVVPLLGFWGLSLWIEENPDRKRMAAALKWGSAIGIGLPLLLLLIGPALLGFASPYDAQYIKAGFPAPLIEALRSDRIQLMKEDTLRSLLLIALMAGGMLLAYLKRIKPAALVLIAGAVAIVDLWPIAKRYDGVNYVSKREYEKPFTPSQVDKTIAQDTTHYRVMNLTVSTFNDASTSYFHNSVGGYHGAKLRRFQDFVDRYASTPLFSNLLNAKYMVYPSQDGQRIMLQQNEDAYGNAWFIDSITPVANADEEIAKMEALDLRRTATLDASRFTIPSLNASQEDAHDTIWLVGHGADWQTYRYHAATPRYAVFSEIYYPRGWNAQVEGQSVDIQRVNYLLRGALLPAGEHEITFRFTLPMFRIGQWVDLGFGMLLLGGLLAWAIRAARRFGQKTESIEI